MAHTANATWVQKNSTRGKTRVLSVSVTEICEGGGRRTALSVVLGHDGACGAGATLLSHVLAHDRAGGVRRNGGCDEAGARGMSDLREHAATLAQ